MSLKSSLFIAQTLAVPVKEPGCRINIAGYLIENYKAFNPDGYTIMCETSRYCDILSFFPNTKTIVLEGNAQSHLLFSDFRSQFIPDLARELNVDTASAFEKSLDFFSDKKVVVQPTGLQGKVYNSMRNIQNFAPIAYTVDAVLVAKTTGITGLRIITAAPLTFVGATYIGGIVCSYFGAVAGNNTLGTIFDASSYILTRPMRGVEITLNGLILKPLSNAIGVPLILNGTSQLVNGKGIDITDYAKISVSFERVSNVTLTNAKRFKKMYDTIKKAITDFKKL